MGLFEKIFRPREAQVGEQASTYFKTLSAYTPAFTTRQGSIYEMDLTRACIHAIATHCSKLKPEVIGSARPALKGVLAVAANEYMNTAQFLYRLRTILEADTTAFIIPLTDPTGNIVTGYWPMLSSICSVVEFESKPWLRYQFPDGKKAAIEFSRVGVLTKYQYTDDFFGGGNAPLNSILDVLDMQDQAMQDAILQSANIRFLARLSQTLRPEDITKERDRFAADNLSADNKSGVMMFDAKYADVKQIEAKPWLIDAEQMVLIKDNVFSYFGVNENILQNSFDENEWNAFYEGCIEPFALAVSLEMTRMTFTQREIATRNAIMFSSNRLQYAANTTKVSVVTQLVDRGLMSNFQAAETFNLPAPPGEERWVIRGEYIDIASLPTNTVENARTYITPNGGNGATPTPAAAMAQLEPLIRDATGWIQRRRESDEKRGLPLSKTLAIAAGKLEPLAEAHRVAGLDFDSDRFVADTLGLQPEVTT
jgi:hypothetical protein